MWSRKRSKTSEGDEAYSDPSLTVLAGNRLPKEPLISEIDGLLTELRMLKPESKELGH